MGSVLLSMLWIFYLIHLKSDFFNYSIVLELFHLVCYVYFTIFEEKFSPLFHCVGAEVGSNQEFDVSL